MWLVAQFPAPLKMPLRGNPLGAPEGRSQGGGELREQPTTVRRRRDPSESFGKGRGGAYFVLRARLSA
ncbi:hypothetical protein GCM10010278_51210 [Streptomyces melanogenes]|nr:hypothetical protein GCM10010278_51210 [Streptomyces melanogenes]